MMKLIICLLFPIAATASNFRNENSNSPQQWSSGITWNQYFDEIDKAANFHKLSLGFNYSQQLPSSDSQQNSWIVTDQESLGLAWNFGDRHLWDFDFSYRISNEPSEKFVTYGGEISLGKTIEFGESKKDENGEDEDFVPSMTIGVRAGKTTLLEKQKVKISKTLATDLSEPQTMTGFYLSLDFQESWSLLYSYENFTYSPNVGSFISYLNTVRPASLSGMSTALGQLNVYDSSTKLIFYFGTNWSLDIHYQVADGLNPGVYTYTYGALISRKLGKSFKIEFGEDQSTPANDYTTNLNLIYRY